MLIEHDDDQVERERKTVGYLIATFIIGGSVVVLACGGILVMFVVEAMPSESSPPDAIAAFDQVVGVDASEFAKIRHAKDTRLGTWQHFRFRYTVRVSIERIVKRHDMVLEPDAEFVVPEIPDWFGPNRAIQNERRLVSRDGLSVLIVDPQRKLGFFQTFSPY